MRKELLEILICPATKEPFELIEFETVKEQNPVSGLSYDQVMYGVLITPSGMAYPIVNGMPRIIEGAMNIYSTRMAAHESRIKSLNIHSDSYFISDDFRKNFLPTQKRFELEWKEHELEGKTWALDQDQRMDKYKEYLNLSGNDYSTSRFLDIGAGTGQFVCTIADTLNCEMIAIDLTPSLERGEVLRRTIKNRDRVNFIQANLMALPFKPGQFDAMHASGVLHHTPNTKKAFDYTQSFVKSGGTFGIWVYRVVHSKIPLIPLINFPSFDYHVFRKVTPRMNPTFLYYLIYCYAAYFQLAYKINQLLRGVKHTRTIKEHTTELFDCLAPPYALMQSPAEVKEWYRAQSFTDIRETDQENYAGFNISGIKQA
ncbi:MAG: methyltransferase domain-containing protein [Bacteroidia bacterium]